MNATINESPIGKVFKINTFMPAVTVSTYTNDENWAYTTPDGNEIKAVTPYSVFANLNTEITQP